MSSVDYYHRNLDGIYTETKSSNKIFDQYAQQYVALWEESYNGSPYRLDILTRIFGRILNKHLCSLCDPWIISCLRQDVLEEIFFKNGLWPEIIMDPRKTRRARNYIRV